MTIEDVVKLFVESGLHVELSGVKGSQRLFVASNWREYKPPTPSIKANTEANPASKRMIAQDVKPIAGLELRPNYRCDHSCSINETEEGWLFGTMEIDVEMHLTSLEEAVEIVEEWFKDIPELSDSSMSLGDATEILLHAGFKVENPTNIIIAGTFGLQGQIMRSLKSYGIMRCGGVLIVFLPNDKEFGRTVIGTRSLAQAVQLVLAFYDEEV